MNSSSQNESEKCPEIEVKKKKRILKEKMSKKACFNCKKSHRKCDDVRPCNNCIKSKRECFDVENRKKKKTVAPIKQNPFLKKRAKKLTKKEKNLITQEEQENKNISVLVDNNNFLTSMPIFDLKNVDEKESNTDILHKIDNILEEINFVHNLSRSDSEFNFPENSFEFIDLEQQQIIHHTNKENDSVSGGDLSPTQSILLDPFNPEKILGENQENAKQISQQNSILSCFEMNIIPFSQISNIFGSNIQPNEIDNDNQIKQKACFPSLENDKDFSSQGINDLIKVNKNQKKQISYNTLPNGNNNRLEISQKNSQNDFDSNSLNNFFDPIILQSENVKQPFQRFQPTKIPQSLSPPNKINKKVRENSKEKSIGDKMHLNNNFQSFPSNLPLKSDNPFHQSLPKNFSHPKSQSNSINNVHQHQQQYIKRSENQNRAEIHNDILHNKSKNQFTNQQNIKQNRIPFPVIHSNSKSNKHIPIIDQKINKANPFKNAPANNSTHNQGSIESQKNFNDNLPKNLPFHNPNNLPFTEQYENESFSQTVGSFPSGKEDATATNNHQKNSAPRSSEKTNETFFQSYQPQINENIDLFFQNFKFENNSLHFPPNNKKDPN